MLHTTDNREPTLDRNSLMRIVGMLHDEGSKYWNQANAINGVNDINYIKGKDFHTAAAELERAYARLGIII